MTTDKYFKKKVAGFAPLVKAVNSAMSTSEIQRIITLVGESVGGIIYFQKGNYTLGPLTILYPNVYIRGSGIGATNITLQDSSTEQGAVFTFSYDDNSDYISNCGISDLTIDGNKANQKQGSGASDGTNTGISIRRVTGFLAERLRIYDCDGYGIGSLGSGAANRANQTFRDIEVSGCNYDNIDIKSGVDKLVLENIYSYSTSGGNIEGRDAVGIDIRGSHITGTNIFCYGNASSNLRIRSNADDHISFTNVHLYSGDDAGLYLDGPSTLNSTWNGLVVHDNTANGITFNNGNHTINGLVSKDNNFGIVVNSSAATTLAINGGFINTNGTDGININGASGSSLYLNNVVLDGNTRRAIDNNAGKVVMNGGAAINNGGDAIYFDDIDANGIFNGVDITGNTGHAFRFDGAASSGNFRITSCDLTSNSGASNSGYYTGTVPTNLKAINNIGLADI